MAHRLVNSLAEAIQHFNQGFLDREDLKTLVNIRNITDQFVNQNLSSDINLKQRLNNIRSIIDVSMSDN